MKILIDPKIFNDQTFGGISRSYLEIYSELIETPGVIVYCPLYYTDNIYFKESNLYLESFQKRNSILIGFSKILRPLSPRKLRKRNLNETISLLKNKSFDLFVPTYYDTYFLKDVGNMPFVLTVYDMIHEIFPEYFLDDVDTIANKKLLIKKATKIIAISKSTKNDIMRIYPDTDEHKIEVVHLAHSIKKNQFSTDLPDNYILFVGNRDHYKNFNFFLEAVSQLLIDNPQLMLVCAGGNAFNNEELDMIIELRIVEQVIQQNFSDKELYNYYSNALFFVFPSKYEGFGIPVLEAMACGCPVVLTNSSSFPEVAEDAAIFFELDDKANLTSIMKNLLDKPQLREEFRKKGLERAKQFNWRKTTQETLEIYKKASLVNAPH